MRPPNRYFPPTSADKAATGMAGKPKPTGMSFGGATDAKKGLRSVRITNNPKTKGRQDVAAPARMP